MEVSLLPGQLLSIAKTSCDERFRGLSGSRSGSGLVFCEREQHPLFSAAWAILIQLLALLPDMRHRGGALEWVSGLPTGLPHGSAALEPTYDALSNYHLHCPLSPDQQHSTISTPDLHGLRLG